MSTHLEDELAAAMREQTAGMRPGADLLDRAARRNRRRTLGMGVGTGVFGLAAVLAVTMTMTALGGPPAAPPADAGPPAAPLVLTAAQVTERAVAALADDDVQHVYAEINAPGRGADHDEQWYDVTTGQARRSSRTADGAPHTDMWITLASDTMTSTFVDHSQRTWYSFTRTLHSVSPSDGGRLTGPAGGTPEELRAALSRGDFALVGSETLDGRAVHHLRRSHEGGADDLWVDAVTYRAVRRDIVKHSPDGDIRVRLDFEWLPRDAAALAPFTVRVPGGYRKIDLAEPVVAPTAR